MNVKAQGLLNGAKWIEEQYGREGIRDVLRLCSEPVRDRYTSAIAINWHPLSEFVEFVSVADRHLGRGDGRLAEELGAAAARAHTRTLVLRAVFYLTRPDLFMQRAATLWRQYNDEGTMAVPLVEPRRVVVRLDGVRQLPRMFCNVLTGWIREIWLASGALDTTVRIIEHVERGESARCLWEARWTKEREGDVPPLSSRSGISLGKIPPR